MRENIGEWISRERVIPPQPSSIAVSRFHDPELTSPPPLGDEPEPISGFTCFIDYEGMTRRISCRRFDIAGDAAYVGAICLSAHGYRTFRTDKIAVVSDALTGEVIGDGTYFRRFAADSQRERTDYWGLKSSQKAALVAGLNVLAFMARCDGQWHPLESEPIDRFVCSMWLRKEWPGEPPLDEIILHAQRLTPDAETFFRGLAHYSQSSTSASILRRAVGSLIEADGVIANAEFKWGLEFDGFFKDYDERQLRELRTMAHEAMIVMGTD